MLNLQITLEGETQLSRTLDITMVGLKDFKLPLTESAAELQKSFQLNFDARGGLFQEGGWPARKDSNPWPLLEKSGALRGSFYSEVKTDEAVLGNNAPYFPYHQSNAPRRRLPRRVMLKIDQTRKAFIVRAFQRYVQNLIGNK